MAKECWCTAYHHPEYSEHPDNQTWRCECCDRAHKLPNTKYIDDALDEWTAFRSEPAPPPFALHFVNGRSAMDIHAFVSGITNRRTSAIVGPLETQGHRLIIGPTRHGKTWLLEELTRRGINVIWPTPNQ